jgi:hypothetical protein
LIVVLLEDDFGDVHAVRMPRGCGPVNGLDVLDGPSSAETCTGGVETRRLGRAVRRSWSRTARPVPGGQDPVRAAPVPVRTTVTGQGAWRTTWSLTEPSSSSLKPPRPRAPTTRRSARTADSISPRTAVPWVA